jgi:polysaccharide pyruvyl transferase WcaK-like protein
MPRGGFPGRTSSRHAARLLLSRWAGAKHIILPQVMGPIRGRLDRSLARRALVSASSITVRDQVTCSILEDLGVTKTRPVAVCPDIAFRFSAAPQRRAQEILGGIGVGDSPLVLVTPNMRVYERSPLHEGKNLYLETMVQLVQNLVDRLHVAVLLIPYELNPRSKDDAWLADEILARLENCEKVFALHEQLGAADIKAITGCAQLLVGSRYHSLIAALSMRVPCVAISWSHKYEMLMGSVELGEYVCHVNDLDFKVLWNKVLALWNKRDEVVPDLERVVSRFESDLNCLFDQVANMVQCVSVEQQVAGDSGDPDG